MPRIYKRRFDWDEAARRYQQGEQLKDLAADYGVSYTAVYNATHPDHYARALALSREWVRGGTCDECGGRMTRSTHYNRCFACAMRARRTSVRDTTLQCFSCRKWLPDDSFPRDAHNEHRRLRHSYCRACNTKAKRAYRARVNAK